VVTVKPAGIPFGWGEKMIAKQLLTWLLASAYSIALAAPIYTRDQTLDEDLRGPRVEWIGEIIATIRDGDYTCFVLERISYDIPAYRDIAQSRFIACNPGSFEVGTYAPGRELSVTGNLGPAVPRKIGDRIYDYPLVAGAFVQLLPYRHYFPEYDPFYRPIYYPLAYYRHYR
jgi:outer membrane lipoprotein